MAKTFNVGVVGYGWAATAHIPSINACPEAQVTAVYSSRPQDAVVLSAEYGGEIRTFTNLDEMLADKSINVIDITSFPDQHAEQSLAAIAAGKHLIIEKPLAMSMEDCHAIQSAARETDVQVCVCFECRFSDQFLVTKRVLDEGLLGSLHYAEVDYYHGIGPWYGQFRWNVSKERGGSSLLTAGCHALDALLLFMGNDVEEVTSYDTKSASETFAPYEYTTSSVTILKFANGMVGKCAAIVDCFQPYYFHTHLVGSHGSLLDDKFQSTRLSHPHGAGWSRLDMKMLDSGDVADHPYQTQFQSFFDSLGRGEAMPLTSLDDAIKTFEVLFAADRSASTGSSVRVADMRGGGR
jgi:UDP-N-acetyl-2-amino-2-deoxyglucuronate dehydrogenase